MTEQEDHAQLEFELRFERLLTLTDGRSIRGAEDDIILRSEGVEVVLARADDHGSYLPVRTVLYPWHSISSVETIGTQVAPLPDGGRWSVTFGGDVRADP